MIPRPRLARAAALVALLGLGAASLATAEPELRESRLEGVVSRVDEASRSFTVRDEKEMETTVWWTSETRIVDRRGKRAEGSRIRVEARVEATCLEQSGKWHATQVRLLD